MTGFLFQKVKAEISHLVAKVLKTLKSANEHCLKIEIRLVRRTKTKANRQPGSMKGKLHVGPEFFEPHR